MGLAYITCFPQVTSRLRQAAANITDICLILFVPREPLSAYRGSIRRVHPASKLITAFNLPACKVITEKMRFGFPTRADFG